MRTWGGSAGYRGTEAVMDGPPQSVEDAPIDLDEASGLIKDLGFVLFRTPADASLPDSCLMTAIHAMPTHRHFDPEQISFWTPRAGRGQLTIIDRDLRLPYSDDFSWGRIRLVDRLGARNSFVSFGGVVTGQRVGVDAVLVAMRSPAPILRLPGHSQREDRLAEEAMSFFSRLVPVLWRSRDIERRVLAAAPLTLYAAFLLHLIGRTRSSALLREALGNDASAAHRSLVDLQLLDPDDVADGTSLLADIGLAESAS
jgi:hypothetical protein